MTEHGPEPTDARDRPTSFSELYPGRFLHADHFKGKYWTLTIADVFREELEGEKGKERKPILAFRETPLLLVAAKINGWCLAKMFGNDVRKWVGRRVTFYPTADLMPMKKGEACIRVQGSPDLTEPVVVVFAPPRRKKVTMTMQVTKGREAKAAPKPEPEPEERGAGT